jgi:hypothetical protein
LIDCFTRDRKVGSTIDGNLSLPTPPIDFLAIDITVMKTPDAMTADEPAPLENNPVTKAHLFSLCWKLSHSADVQQWIQERNIIE